MKILAIDIERSPMVTYRWDIKPNWLNTDMIIEPSSTISFASRWVGQPRSSIEFYSDFTHGHTGMVEAAWQLIDEADALLTWNGIRFDEPHLFTEFFLEDLGSPSGTYHIDLMAQAKKRFNLDSNKLDYVSKRLGLAGKVKHAGFGLWVGCMAGDPKSWRSMERYNKQDVHLLIQHYERMKPFLKLPNQNLFEVLNGCPTPGCKGTPQKRGFRPTQIGLYQKYSCPVCRRWFSSGKAVERSDLRGI